MLTLTYATNPHERLLSAHLPPALREINDRPLSLNALRDVLLGRGILSSTNAPCSVAFVKHDMPVLAFSGANSKEAFLKLKDAALRAKNVEFGTIVIKGELDGPSLQQLEPLRFHTVAADAFSPEAQELLSGQAAQQRNRGLVGVICAGIGPVRQIGMFGDEIKIIAQDHAALITEQGFPNTQHNDLWADSSDLMLATACLAHARTISVVVGHSGGVPLVRCGFFDGLSALRETLRNLKEIGLDPAECTILTDGCFGVHSPIPHLTQSGVRQFFFCGGKLNDQILLDQLGAAGIGAFCTGKRLFHY